MVKFKLFQIMILGGLLIPVLTYAQNENKKSISAEEKRRLENQFKDLKTFYIADDGTVVYQQPVGGDSTQQTSIPTAYQFSETSRQDSASESGSIHEVVVEESNTAGAITALNLSTESYSDTESISNTGKVYYSKEANYLPVQTQVVVEVQNNNVNTAENESLTEIDNSEPIVKHSVFRKKEIKSSYNSLEEAAMAVDAKLEELMKEQQSLKSTGRRSSMSSINSVKDVRNMRRSSSSYSSNTSDLPSSATLSRDTNANGEAVYYINGVMVTKEDIDRLKSNEILKKQIKSGRTNPNGEIWVETIHK